MLTKTGVSALTIKESTAAGHGPIGSTLVKMSVLTEGPTGGVKITGCVPDNKPPGVAEEIDQVPVVAPPEAGLVKAKVVLEQMVSSTGMLSTTAGFTLTLAVSKAEQPSGPEAVPLK